MGKRGPQPKASKIKRLEGQHESQIQPEGPKCELPPEPPHALGEIASAIWSRIMSVTPPGLITAMDETTLTLYCETWETRERLKQTLSKTLIRKGSTGQRVIDPGVVQIDRATDKLVKLGAKLGLSPADRNSLAAPFSGNPVAPGPKTPTLGGGNSHLIGRPGSSSSSKH